MPIRIRCRNKSLEGKQVIERIGFIVSSASNPKALYGQKARTPHLMRINLISVGAKEYVIDEEFCKNSSPCATLDHEKASEQR